MPNLPKRQSPAGPIRNYLEGLVAAADKAEDAALRQRAVDAMKAVRRVLATDDGEILMDLLTVATTDWGMDPLSDARALAAINAQSLIAHDLRRIESDEHYLGNAASNAGGASRTGRRTGRG